MTQSPKEYAIDLYNRFAVNEFNPIRGWYVAEGETKDLCKGIVEEIIKSNPLRPINIEFGDAIYYYQEVLKEIQLIK